MARVGLRKEQVKSILLCKDREFKRKTVAHLNNSAFAAEKFTVENMADALDILERDLDIENFVVDAVALSSQEIRTMFELYQRRSKNPEIRFLIYLDEASQTNEKNVILQFLPKANIHFMPTAQIHFNKAFHSGRSIPEAVPLVAPELGAKEPPAIALIETSAHIKETVELLNSVSKDRSRLDILQQIGQRFNGIIGTFAFFGNKTGYVKVKELATLIDDISRTYEDAKDSSKLSDKHWQLLMEGAKTLYLILKDLRENRPLTPAYVDKANSIIALYQKDGGIRKRASHKQEDIDRIVDVANELLNKSS